MSKVKTFIKLLCYDREKILSAFFLNFNKTKLSHFITDKAMIKMQYRAVFGKKIDLNNPKSFNEKLQWLKLYDRNNEYIKLVDKFEVRSHIKNEIGEEYLIPLLGIWDNCEEIDYAGLPNQFVLKCTHDSGSVLLCEDKQKFDFQKAKIKLEKSLNKNLFWHGREWPYKNVKPRIMAEAFMMDDKTTELRDYKFFCFNGKVKCVKIDFDRFKDHRANYYSVNGELLPFGECICPPDFNRKLEMPKNMDKMIELAEKLSAKNSFLRVDFYEVNNKIYFGELTFFPASGFGPFTEEEWDYKLGEYLVLPNNK